MIELITGKPGAGKTYLVVHRLMELSGGKYVIFTNIDGLDTSKLPEPHMVKVIPGDIREWGQKDNQIKYAEAVREKYGRSMLVVIDEAQTWFGDKDAGLKGWLSWHRHLGQDIWLVTQHAYMLHKDYNNLAEYEIRALKSIVLNQLVYQYRMGGEAFKTIRKKRRPEVYAAYRSFDGQEVAKGGAGLVIWLLGAAVLCVGFAVWFFFSWGPKAPEAAQRVAVKEKRAAGVAVEGNGKSAPVVEDVWSSCSYVGLLAGQVLVRDGGGKLVPLEWATGERYVVLEASGRYTKVRTASGDHVLVRKQVQEAEHEGAGVDARATSGRGAPRPGRVR